MAMEVFTDIEQGTPEWLQVRAGIPTSSRFNVVAARPGPRGGQTDETRGRAKYMRQLTGERITGQPMNTFSGHHMQRGHVQEPKARNLYAMLTGADVRQIGFVRNGNCGCSPDAFVNSDGLLEIKDALPDIQIERLQNGEIPPEHVDQCRGALRVCEKQWIDFMSHCEGLPPLIVRMDRNERQIAALRVDIDQFCEELDTLERWVRSL